MKMLLVILALLSIGAVRPNNDCGHDERCPVNHCNVARSEP
jgi:hypothetical protein